MVQLWFDSGFHYGLAVHKECSQRDAAPNHQEERYQANPTVPQNQVFIKLILIRLLR